MPISHPEIATETPRNTASAEVCVCVCVCVCACVCVAVGGRGGRGEAAIAETFRSLRHLSRGIDVFNKWPAIEKHDTNVARWI